MFNIFRRKVVQAKEPTIIFPTQEQISQIMADCSFSPDAWKLEQHAFQLVFIYDEHMRGMHKHKVLQEGGAMWLATAFTESKFSMFKKNLAKESYPFTLESKWDLLHKGAQVKGEIYAMRPYFIQELDKHKLHKVEFLRRRVSVVVPYRVVCWTKQHGKHISEELTIRVPV